MKLALRSGFAVKRKSKFAFGLTRQKVQDLSWIEFSGQKKQDVEWRPAFFTIFFDLCERSQKPLLDFRFSGFFDLIQFFAEQVLESRVCGI